MKVTVKERSGAGLSGLQLVIVSVLAGVTLGVVGLTAALILQGRCRRRGHAPCWSSATAEAGPTEEPEHRISFLNEAEPHRKKLNIEVI